MRLNEHCYYSILSIISKLKSFEICKTERSFGQMGIVRAGAGESDTLAFGPAMRRTQRVRAQSDAACHVGPQVALYACVWRQKLTRADKGIEAGQGVPRRRERKCTEWSGGGTTSMFSVHADSHRAGYAAATSIDYLSIDIFVADGPGRQVRQCHRDASRREPAESPYRARERHCPIRHRRDRRLGVRSAKRRTR